MCVRAAIVHIIYSKMGIDQMPNFKTSGGHELWQDRLGDERFLSFFLNGFSTYTLNFKIRIFGSENIVYVALIFVENKHEINSFCFVNIRNAT